MSIAENLDRIQHQIAGACRRGGRSTSDVQLMGVSKTHPAEAIDEAYTAGLRLFGENRVQEFQQKLPLIQCFAGPAYFSGAAQSDSPHAHLIGPLQSNKSAKAAQLFHSIDTVDSLKLAQRLNDAAASLNKQLTLLIEIKLSHEESKHGLEPSSPELAQILEHLPDLKHLRPRGLMTVPPFSEDPEAARPYFRQLRTLRDQLAAAHPLLDFAELSMGMSHDFQIGIEEGSTCVRIGTALFGQRPRPA